MLCACFFSKYSDSRDVLCKTEFRNPYMAMAITGPEFGRLRKLATTEHPESNRFVTSEKKLKLLCSSNCVCNLFQKGWSTGLRYCYVQYSKIQRTRALLKHGEQHSEKMDFSFYTQDILFLTIELL